MDVHAQLLDGAPKDVVVVEGQLRQAVDGEPLRAFGIVATLHLRLLGQRIEGDGNHPFARVAADGSEGLELFEVVQVQAGLFSQLALCALLSGLIHAEESIGQSPTAFVRLDAAFNEQNLQLAPIEAEHHTVCGHGGTWVVVSVFLFFHLV